MDNIMAEGETDEENELNIARRTRSHLKFDDFVPNDNLDFPDVDMNLYQNPDSEGDPEYKKFLDQCYSEEIETADTNNDDNDPEYVYNDDIFSHGWRFDLDEVSEFNQEDTSECQQGPSCSSKIINDDEAQFVDLPKVSVETQFKSPLKVRRKIDMFADPEFARILNQQLRQHIQLLTQTFLLTKNTTTMRNEAEEAKNHLLSYMKIFKNKSKPSNLLPALELVETLPTPKDLRSAIRLSWRPLQIPEWIKNIIHSNQNIFIYPSLLPQVAFSILPEKLVPKKPKINFTTNEDKLLAYALNEFRGETSQYAFIASLLMTAKTKTQISNHIKNIKRSPGNENNPIKLYFANGELPDINLDSDSYLNITEVVDEEVKQEPVLEVKDRADSKMIEKIIVQGQQQQLLQQEHVEVHANEIEKEKEENDKEKIELDSEIEHPDKSPRFSNTSYFYQEQDGIMNMDLDDLMAASSTISKSTAPNVNNSDSNNNNKNIKNLKLKKSMLNLMSHNFVLSSDMADLIIHDFLKTAQQKLSERNNLHLLQLLSDLMRKESHQETDQSAVEIYQTISKFLDKIKAPPEIHEKIVLFLDLDQATKCGRSFSYLHWMKFFQFMQHVELYHDGVEALEKKLVRLIDALQKDDSHKVKLAIANLVNKHPFLKREFESLALEEKPHSSLFICEEDFDDITDPINMYNNFIDDKSAIYNYEHFHSKLSKEELSYASQTCPCKCHSGSTSDGQPSQHCGKCNLKFMKGRMYLVNKIKPILAEWSYADTMRSSTTTSTTAESSSQRVPLSHPPHTLTYNHAHIQPTPLSQVTSATNPNQINDSVTVPKWTLEEDREILEFCRSKAENEETISFDTSTFEELVNKRSRVESNSASCWNNCKKSACEIAERFNQLMELYNKDEQTSSGVQ